MKPHSKVIFYTYHKMAHFPPFYPIMNHTIILFKKLVQAFLVIEKFQFIEL